MRGFFYAATTDLINCERSRQPMATLLGLAFPDEWIPYLQAAVILAATIVVASLARRFFNRVFERTPLPTRWGLHPGHIVQVIIWIVGLLALGAAFHIDVSSVIIGLGAFSIAVSFAMSTMLNNIISGLLIHADRSVRIGEVIDLGSFRGRVVRISARTTELRTKEGDRVIVPNAYLAQNPFRNMGREKQPE